MQAHPVLVAFVRARGPKGTRRQLLIVRKKFHCKQNKYLQIILKNEYGPRDTNCCICNTPYKFPRMFLCVKRVRYSEMLSFIWDIFRKFVVSNILKTNRIQRKKRKDTVGDSQAICAVFLVEQLPWRAVRLQLKKTWSLPGKNLFYGTRYETAAVMCSQQIG